MQKKIAIVGAGLSGLACAVELVRNQIQVTMFEASDKVGGRVKTDNVEGFLLDQGFQVFIPSYEMGSYFLNYDKLKLKAFSPGAYILKDNRMHLMSDPLRRPSDIITTALSPLATFKDKLLTIKFILKKSVAYENIQSTSTAIDYLKNFGFSEQYINNFFIPFFSGVFLSKDLKVPADYFKYLFDCFSKSYASLPKQGMGEIPKQMAIEVGRENIVLNNKTKASDLLQKGYDHVFVSHVPQQDECCDLKFHGVKTEYYKTRSQKWASKTLYLNSAKNSVVNHIACLTAVNPDYAPEGWHLFSVNTIANPDRDSKQDLIDFFGADEIKTWQLLKTYNIKKALPAETKFGNYLTSTQPNISFCGDYLESPSIQGALYSGRKAARNYLKLNT